MHVLAGRLEGWGCIGLFGASSSQMYSHGQMNEKQGIDALLTAVRTLESRVIELSEDVAAQAARLAAQEREGAGPRAQAATIQAMQVQQDQLLRLMLQHLDQQPQALAQGAVRGLMHVDEHMAMFQNLRSERIQVAEMLENVRAEKLDVISMMHGFQVNKDLALREIEDTVSRAVSGAECALTARPGMGRSSTGSVNGGTERQSAGQSKKGPSTGSVGRLVSGTVSQVGGGSLAGGSARVDAATVDDAVAAYKAAAAVPQLGSLFGAGPRPRSSAGQESTQEAWRSLNTLPGGSPCPQQRSIAGTAGRAASPVLLQNHQNSTGSVSPIYDRRHPGSLVAGPSGGQQDRAAQQRTASPTHTIPNFGGLAGRLPGPGGGPAQNRVASPVQHPTSSSAGRAASPTQSWLGMGGYR